MKSKLPVVLICLAFMAGCKDDDQGTVEPSGLIYSYYPVNDGHELIYDVKLITKDEFTGAHDTSLYQLKEVVESTITDNQGRPTQRLERYTRATSNDSWMISEVWTSNITPNNVERKEENITYVKMVFPIKSSSSWNGNVFNTEDNQTYRYIDLHTPATVGTLTFDSTITVLQIDEVYWTEKYYSEEKFAKDVGLIYRENIEIIIDRTNPGQPGIKGQRLYTQTLVSYEN